MAKLQPMATSPKRRAPSPIFDNLSVVGRDCVTALLVDARPIAMSDINAEQDYAVALRFLRSYDGSTATFNAYRRELERLCQWSWHVRQSSILAMTREDIEAFVQFTLNPPRAWIGTKNVARFVRLDGHRVPNPDWRPFVVTVSKSAFRDGGVADAKHYTPTQSTIKATFTALSSFYDFLTQESLVKINPIKLIRQKSKYLRKDHNQAPVRRVSNLQWDYVIETAERMADEEPAVHERTLFIMTALFAMYLRISELVTDERSAPVMGDFRKDLDGNWWYHVTGKGNKDRTVTVSTAMLKALKRYRRSLALPLLPAPNESTPVVPKQLGRGPITSSRQVRLIVQSCFDAAYQRMRDDGMEQDAAELKSATVHWLRHTGISEDVKHRPREHVRDDAGHSSMATTDRYVESDRRERHLSGRKKRVKDI